MSERVNEESSGAGVSEAQAGNALTIASPEIKEERQWSVGLKSRDCTRLMDLLHKHPRLWLKTDADDRNVLHVAVMQGCVELTKQVLNGTPVENSNRQEFHKNTKKLLYAKDGKCKADTFRLAAIVGNEEMIQILESTRKSRPMQGGPSSQSTHDGIDSSEPNASHHMDMKSTHLPSRDDYDDGAILELFQELPRSKLHEALQKQMRGDVDYNFEPPHKALLFHFACKKAHSNIDFLRSVAVKANEKPGLLRKLFNEMDAQGRTPLHVAIEHCRGAELRGIQELLDMAPDESCVNGRDGAGRTPLLRATANGMSMDASKVVKILADDPRTDLNAKWPGAASGATALHVAVLHGHGTSARYVLEARRDDPAQRADLEKQMSRCIKVFKLQWYLTWTPLELAAVMGRHSVLANILQACTKSRRSIRDERCLHLAAAAGNPQSIQALLMNRYDNLCHFESNQYFGGYSCLHFAVYASLPHQPFHNGEPPNVKAIDEKFDRFLAFSDFASVFWLQQELTNAASKGPQKLGMPVIGYGSKKTCTTLLLQAGVDIWPSGNILKNTSRSTSQELEELEEETTQGGQDFHLLTSNITWDPGMPDPGNNASDDARIWWYELVSKDTLELKTSFNAAGNATAVVATLVATASFIGPLTPPLGYGSDTWTMDRVQMTSLGVRVFMVSNSLSFYLAIASIMLAIMPSLPMPQEGLREELRRSRRTVALSISVLLISILGLLVSFTSCLIAVMPKTHYWGYTFYPEFVGGIVCSVVLFLFFLRLLRLVFNRNAKIKTFYHFFGKL